MQEDTIFKYNLDAKTFRMDSMSNIIRYLRIDGDRGKSYSLRRRQAPLAERRAG